MTEWRVTESHLLTAIVVLDPERTIMLLRTPEPVLTATGRTRFDLLILLV